MKKLIIPVLIVLGIFFIFRLIGSDDYSIENMEIHAFLQENGDVHVTEDQTYAFTGEYNGMTRTLIPKKDTSIVNIEATENDQPLSIKQDGDTYKIHRSAEDETVSIQLTYTIKDAVESYADVAEFYWPFFDTNNESDYEQFDVFVHPPTQTNDVIAYGYDAAEGSAMKEQDGVAHFSMGKVPRETNGDIRVAYDEALFPGATKIKDEPMQASLIAQKSELEKQRVEFEARQSKLRTVTPFVIGIMTIILILLFIYAGRNKRVLNEEVNRLYSLPDFVPENEMSLPATISFTNLGILGVEGQMAGFLDLIRKGYVKQVDEETFHVEKRDTDYPHEQFMMKWLFDEVGQDGVFHFDDLKAYTDDKKNSKKYFNDSKAWEKQVKSEVKQNQLKEKNTIFRLFIGLLSILVLPLSILLFIYQLYGFLILSIVLFLAFSIFAISYRPLTVQGAKIKRDWKSLREKYIDMDEHVWSEQVNNEQMRAIIYGIGYSDQQIRDKNETLLDSFPEIKTSQRSSEERLLIRLNLIRMKDRFITANKASSSAASGGGSRRGTGVGGGGGGSGAF